MTGDTIRLDDVAKAVAEAEQEEGPAEQPAGEPAAQEEEPAEQPAYVPPAPIPFRPRSRLRELKRKLIAGPEKRYYELSEMGLGKLQAAIMLSLAVVILSAGAGVLYAFDMIPENRMRLMVFCQI